MKQGNLFNNAGEGHYTQEKDMENVIRYILRQREHESRADELILWGGYGVPEWKGAQGIIDAFKQAQKSHTRKGTFGRYIDHEYYTFTDEEAAAIDEANVDLGKLTRKMANEFYQDGTQVVYAVHKKESRKGGENMHIHFAVNTVVHKNGKKRRENMTDTKERSKRLNKIVQESIRMASESLNGRQR